MFKRFENLNGKTAVIIGCNGQVGSATARRLADCGARIIGITRSNLEQAQSLLASLPNQEANHAAYYADITKSETLSQVVSVLTAQIGKIDILINSAGITKTVNPVNLDALTDELFDEIVTVNLRGVYASIRAFAPLLKASGDGLIVNVSSTAGQCASVSNVAYGASKAGLDLMTKTLGKALAPTVRVLGVVPGVMEYSTSGVGPKPPGFNEKMAEGCPLKRIGYGDDIASAIEACCTHIRFATGTTFLVDGGRTV